VSLIRECWHRRLDVRPSWEEIHRRLTFVSEDPEIVTALVAQTRGPAGAYSNWQTRRNQAKGLRLTEDILSDMFPPHIADSLKQGRKVEPEYKDNISVCLSDIVGFTQISERMGSGKVCDMLDRLYTKLDAIAAELNVFKLETIGDAYMAVSNLVADQASDHAVRIAVFATRAILAARTTLVDADDVRQGYVCMRIGISSGPTVAHVIGTSRPKYTLFGDTINTASRMETNALPGLIQCSQVTALLCKAQIQNPKNQIPEDWHNNVFLQPRGKINVKGKKEAQHTFWVSHDLEELRLSLQEATRAHALLAATDHHDVSVRLPSLSSAATLTINGGVYGDAGGANSFP
jgi:class 3 adenylate cyclase